MVGDFETTVYEGQESTEVWASAIVPLYSENVKIFHSIEETYNYLVSLHQNIILYYHNLKFDGAFWMDYLINVLHMPQAFEVGNEETLEGSRFLPDRDMKNFSFKYLISDRGQWYAITMKINSKIIELWDSYKLLPFSVKNMGKSFGTKHHKLDMEYVGYRYAGCEITDEEKKYIANDVLVVKEALEIMYNDNHKSMTIGSCCFKEFKKMVTSKEACFARKGVDRYEDWFPDLTNFLIDEEIYGFDNADSYIRKSYKGGWCYVVRGKAHKKYKNGVTADVNSLYPSVMHSDSGNRYPVSIPRFWNGNFIPEKCMKDDIYFFVKIKTRFYIKKNKLPFIQIKGNMLYRPTECLETSDVYDKKTNRYYDKYYAEDGTLKDTRVELTLTKTDYILFREHYKVLDFEILSGCWFNTEIGMFDMYIDKYKKIKETSKGAKRTEAKLFSNNLYGKMATSRDSSFKYAFIRDDGAIGYRPVYEYDKKAGYIAIGSAITSYARDFTIRHAQMNYYGKNKRGFIYADTDSIHCDLQPEELNGIEVHPTKYGCWKLETYWDIGYFTRQKTYIEHVTHEDGEPVDEPYYNVKCAGLPEKCKDLFRISLGDKSVKEREWTEDEKIFLFDSDGNLIKRTVEDFDIGLTIPGKLMPKRLPGGIVLKETLYQMR